MIIENNKLRERAKFFIELCEAFKALDVIDDDDIVIRDLDTDLIFEGESEWDNVTVEAGEAVVMKVADIGNVLITDNYAHSPGDIEMFLGDSVYEGELFSFFGPLDNKYSPIDPHS